MKMAIYRKKDLIGRGYFGRGYFGLDEFGRSMKLEEY